MKCMVVTLLYSGGAGKLYITNKYDSVRLPYSVDLLEWLCENYPYSDYRVVNPA